MSRERCPFCPPEEERLILEAGPVAALWDGYPLNPGHALIIPRRHIAGWADATDDERRAIFELVEPVMQEIRRRHDTDGFNLGLNDGEAAGQTVPHLHLHVIPRQRGDVADPRGGVRWVVPARARYWADPER